MPGNNRSVLVVDDENALRDIFVAWFRRAGYEVSAAQNGAEALSICGDRRIDLVVSDMRMPVMDGITLARRLQDGRSPVPKILLVTGFADLSVMEAYALGSVQSILSKPTRRSALLAEAERALQDRAARWCGPMTEPLRNGLRASYPSLPQALGEGGLRLGQGGLSLEASSTMQTNEPLRLALEFADEARRIEAQAILCWSDSRRRRLGLEIRAVAPDSRDWALEVFASHALPAHIPE
ncbi:response regulator [Roseomonas frigidaquae]|uniref:Response regulator n=1 Tax=Falsiroseomonas frigidaquae TaxID=487318 RepID=A0ABX1F6N0_9PROT|nr:response regulator [Falsiroseomonas frigidaquae]NKE48032.1 response regulator [Falsiroseomonas frigidaquae]